ncbi:ABC transporter permease [Paracoccus sp. KR1-242]|uniref:ABC transporter permease n=1 Tax=Paracoccus sp. KR1-242 TaxID=3410028 RepID=UPI003C04C056
MADVSANLGVANVTASQSRLFTTDGRSLKTALAAAQVRAKRRALLLVLPLLLFLVISFVMPIAQMLLRSVHNDAFSANMPVLSAWFNENPNSAPDEAAYAALVSDLRHARADKTAGLIGTRVNYDLAGSRSLFTAAARKAEGLKPPYREAAIDLSADWGDSALWQAMRSASSAYTTSFFLAALDLTRDTNGKVVRVEEGRRIYVSHFVKTFTFSAVITAICLLLAYPVAHMLATLPLGKSNLLMILVLLPFWTSLLVRTTSWMVLLQEQGVVNNALVASGVVDPTNRLAMMYNQTGTVIAMVHILLPFMILPLYAVMRPIKPHYTRAARSLGASSWTAFRQVYLPQTLPGIGAGTLLVFILAVGYYITPALVGGASGQMISNFIAYHMQGSLNWSMAAALAAILLAAVLLLYWLYDRLIGIDNIKLG